jgi:hypothetical protein
LSKSGFAIQNDSSTGGGTDEPGHWTDTNQYIEIDIREISRIRSTTYSKLLMCQDTDTNHECTQCRYRQERHQECRQQYPPRGR